MSTTVSVTRQIADKAITYAKIQDLTTQILLGRYAGTNGVAQEITIGSGLSLNSGTGILSATGSGGTVTTVSVVSANGFAGTVATATSTPAITLTTTISGMIKGSSSALVAATSGTDYSAGTSALATGILKSTTTTGALSIAVAGDFPTLNQNTTGSAATLTTSRNIYGNAFNGSADLNQVIASTYGGTGNGFTKFTGPTTTEKTFTLPNASAVILTDNALVTVAQGGSGVGTITGLIKGNGTSPFSAAVANTDYVDTTYTGFDSRYVKLAGSTMTGLLILSADPSAALGAATKQYVDNLATGLSWKQAVRAATTANGTLATAFENGDVIDGVTLVTGDRILLKNQTTQTENGIYTVNVSGAPTRATDADTGPEILGLAVFVLDGTVNGDTQWTNSNNSAITVGSTNITFAQISGSGTYTNGTGISLTGNVFSLDVTYTNTLYVPLARSLTINGSAQTLAADRTWTITTTGTTNRITVTGGTGLTPTIDIHASYVGQTSITTLGTITTGVWNGTAISLTTYASGTLQAAQFPALTGEATTSAGSLAVTLTNSAVIGKVLTGYTSGAGTITSSDSILTAIQKLNGNDGLMVQATRFIVKETPSGTVNGSNVTFTLANTPVSGKEEIYVNGIQQDPGAGNDYTISGATITFLTGAIPQTGDKVRASYIY